MVLYWWVDFSFILGVFFQAYYIELHERIKLKNAVYRLQISALVLEIFKYKISVKYANKMADDIKYSTQCYIRYINRAILANLQCRPLKLGRLIVLHETYLRPSKVLLPCSYLFSSPHPLDFNMLVIVSLKEANSSTWNIPIAIKKFCSHAAISFPAPTHLISIGWWLSAWERGHKLKLTYL